MSWTPTKTGIQPVDKALNKLKYHLNQLQGSQETTEQDVDDLQTKAGLVDDVFLKAFDSGVDGWNVRTGSGTTDLPSNGSVGGKVLEVDGYYWVAYPDNIIFHPNRLYRMRVRARMTTAPTDDAKDRLYVGVEGVASDGETLVNINGSDSYASQHYVGVNGDDMGSHTLGEWQEYIGYFQGRDASPGGASGDPRDPSTLHESVRYIRPMLIANYNGGDGVMEVDAIALEIVTESAEIDALETFNAPNEPGADATAGKSLWSLTDREPAAVGAEPDIHVGTSAPDNTDHLWLDTSEGEPYILYRHDGTVWVRATSQSGDIDALLTINGPTEADAEQTTGKSLDLLVDRYLNRIQRAAGNSTTLATILGKMDDVGDLLQNAFYDDGLGKRTFVVGRQGNEHADGDTILFEEPFQNTPTIIFAPGGKIQLATGGAAGPDPVWGNLFGIHVASQSGGSTDTTIYDYVRAEGLSASGFTLVAKLIERDVTVTPTDELFVNSYLSLPGESGDDASTPDSTALDITGDIDLRAAVALDDWASGDVAQLLDNLDGNGGYRLQVSGGGALQLRWRDAAGNVPLEAVSLSIDDGSLILLRATLDVDNGASGYDVKIYTKESTPRDAASDLLDNSGWTQAGTTQTGGSTTDIAASSDTLTLGSFNSSSRLWSGKYYAAAVLDGIDGTVAFNADFTAEVPGTTSFTEDSANAATVTVNQSGSPQAEIVEDGTTHLLTVQGDTTPHELGGDAGDDAYDVLYDYDISVDSTDSLSNETQLFPGGTISAVDASISEALDNLASDDVYNTSYDVDLDVESAGSTTSQNFPSGNIDAVDEDKEVSLNDAALDNAYQANFSVTVDPGEKLTIACETSTDGGASYTSQGTRSYDGDGMLEPTINGAFSFTESLASGDLIRIRVTSVTGLPSCDPDDVEYSTADTYTVDVVVAVDHNGTQKATETISATDDDGTGTAVSEAVTEAVTDSGLAVGQDIEVRIDSITETGSGTYTLSVDPDRIEYTTGSADTATLTIEVAIDSRDGTDAWVERVVNTHEVTDTSGSGNSKQGSASGNFASSSIASGDDVRVRLKSVDVSGSDESNSVSVDPDKVAYNVHSGTETRHSKTPVSGDTIRWDAIAG